MAAIQQCPVLSVADYLAAEKSSPVRHEFVDGELFMMAGESLRHNTIALNLAVLLRSHLRGSPCRTFMEGVKVHVMRDNAYYYPDVVVSCSENVQALGSKDYVVAEPLLLIEVLSGSTASIDRREKLISYRKLPSLKEYVLVSQDEAAVTLYRRRNDLVWDQIVFSAEDVIDFSAVELLTSFAEIYEGVPTLP